MSIAKSISLVFLLLVLVVWPRVLFSQTDFEGPPINYLTAEVNDPVARFATKIKDGEARLRFDDNRGYLASVLEGLDVPVSSQVLVFSKTSLQLSRISPRRPRAIYFNDDVYVGYCQNGDVIEFATTDAKQGAIFYTLKQESDIPPTFVRDRGQCLSCHASSRTQYVPGYLIRSVFADRAGHAILGSGTFTTDQKSPFEQRWGGWYVTGTHGRMRHMGNSVFIDNANASHDLEAGANVESLENLVSTEPYLSQHSDLVALMVLAHQTQMHNVLAAANYETRTALRQSFDMNKLLDRDEGHISDIAQRRIEAAADRVVSYLLMADELELADEVQGTSDFAKEFQTQGIRDSRGRSLREFDLKTRLFRYPCSYLIYNPAFDGLPEEVRTRISAKLAEILSSTDSNDDFPHLDAATRQVIREILIDTKPGLLLAGSNSNRR